MKAGRGIQELAAELERRTTVKHDYLPHVGRNAQAVIDSQARPALELNGLGSFPLTRVAHEQIGGHTGIPAKYYERCRTELPGLLVNNINAWFEKFPAERLLRTLDGQARAFLSNRYRPMENFDLANAVFPVLLEQDLDIMSAEVTETKLYIKAVHKNLKRDVPAGRKMGDGSHVFFRTNAPAIIISNSEVGYGRLSVDTGVFDEVCTNLAMFTSKAARDAGMGMKRTHLGGKLEAFENMAVRFTDKTQRVTDAALWMQVRDVVASAFDEGQFNQRMDVITGMGDDRLGGDVVKSVEFGSRLLGYTAEEGKSVLRHLIEGGDLSRYGFYNAVTRAANDVEDYDRSTELQAMGGAVVELKRSDWQTIAEAA